MDLTYLEWLAATASGLLAGALVTEAFVLVPYWQKMKPNEFLQLHPSLAPLLFRFYAPLTIVGTVLPIVTCALEWTFNTSAKWQWTISAVCGVGLIAFYFGFFRQANLRFATLTSAEDAATTLASWAIMHRARTVLAVLGFVLAQQGLT